MVEITVEVPEELERRARLLNMKLSILVAGAVKEQIKKAEKIERIRIIASKSKATDKDVEEITNEIKDAVWKHYEKYAK